MVGRTTSVWGRSAKPTEPWRNIRAGGFASGCVSNTKSGQGGTRFPLQALHQRFGLVRLAARTTSFPWAKRESFSESWMR